MAPGFPFSLMQIFLAFSFLSPVVIVLMGLMPKGVARRAAVLGLLVLLPTLGVSCATLLSQGDGGFLSTSQFISMGLLLLLASLGVGHGIATIRHRGTADDRRT